MKKLVLFLIVLFIFSCNDYTDFYNFSKKNEATDFLIEGKRVKMKFFEDKNEKPIVFGIKTLSDIENIIDFQYFLKENQEIQTKINDKLAGFVVFCRNNEKNVKLSDIEAVLFYFRDKDIFKTYLVENQSGSFILDTLYTRYSNFISSNDIFQIHHKKYNSEGSFYVFLNENRIKPFSLKDNELQYFLKEAISWDSYKCYSPCEIGEEGRCIVIGKGDDWEGEWLCSTIADGLEKECVEENTHTVLGVKS